MKEGHSVYVLHSVVSSHIFGVYTSMRKAMHAKEYLIRECHMQMHLDITIKKINQPK